MKIIEKYFAPLSPSQSLKFRQLGPLYEYWNQRINLISRKDIEHLYMHHILHSLSVAKILPFKTRSLVIDAGTGGGFPGIPLAIMFPEVQFILVDSIAKKIRVVETIIRETGLDNCQAMTTRLEALRNRADFVVCRAVTAIPVLFGWVRKNIIPGGRHELKNGLLALKGGDLENELGSLVKVAQVFNLKDYFEEEYFETKKLVYLPV